MKKKKSGSGTLRKIVAAAKKIRAAHPGLKWTNCIKAAAKKL